MVSIHFPFIEAGRIRSLCGTVHAHLDWTTATGKVTCPRCRKLLRSSDGPEPLPRLPPRAADPAVARKTGVTAKAP